jgi:hypothetical protein
MFSCPKCEHLVTFDHFGEPYCLCTAKQTVPRRFWIGVTCALALLGIGILLWILLDQSLHAHFDPNSYCAYTNRGNCDEWPR